MLMVVLVIVMPAVEGASTVVICDWESVKPDRPGVTAGREETIEGASAAI